MDSLVLLWTQVILLVSTGSGILGQSPGDVRLVDGSSSLEGRVEVYYDNEWGTICNQGWDSTDSGVVCRQLGFQVSLSSPSFGAGIPTQRIWLADVQCESSDLRLNECVTDDQWGQTSTCPHNNDVGVRCSGLNVGIAPNYRGCYRFEDEVLSNTAITFPSNTIETCLESCSINFMFAGLYGTICTCGDQVHPSAQPVDNTMCRMPCPGNSAQLCGDDEVNMQVLSIYSVSVGDGYVSSSWFPGNYVLPSTDISQPENLISTTDVTASSGMLLIRVLAFDLAPGETLSVEVGGMTISPTASGETMLSGLPETPLVLTATLTRAANSAGASGYLITFTRDPITTIPQTTPTKISAAPKTNLPQMTLSSSSSSSSPALQASPQSRDPNSTSTSPDVVTASPAVPATSPPPTDEANGPVMTTASVTIPPNSSSTPYAVRQCIPWLIPVLASVIVLQFIIISVLLMLFCYQPRRKVRTRTGENGPDPYMDLQPRPEAGRIYQEMAITSTASSKNAGERHLPSPNLIYENQNVAQYENKIKEGAHYEDVPTPN